MKDGDCKSTELEKGIWNDKGNGVVELSNSNGTDKKEYTYSFEDNKLRIKSSSNFEIFYKKVN